MCIDKVYTDSILYFVKYKDEDFDFSKEKDRVLKEKRDLGFEDIIQAIKSKDVLDDKKHPNQKKYPGQRLFVVKIGKYIYSVPYVYDRKRKVYFLKTLYPSRKLVKEYKKI